jgi:hypothetical protein
VNTSTSNNTEAQKKVQQFANHLWVLFIVRITVEREILVAINFRDFVLNIKFTDVIFATDHVVTLGAPAEAQFAVINFRGRL